MTLSPISTTCPRCNASPQISKTKIAVGLGITAVAVAALLYQKQQLEEVQHGFSQILKSIKDLKNSVSDGKFELGSYIGLDGKCLHSYTPYKLEVEFSKSNPDVQGITAQVKELYNNATSFSTNIFSRYGYRATHSFVEQNSDKMTATFLICRSGLSNLFSSPWRD